MKSIRFKKLLLIPALLLASCGGMEKGDEILGEEEHLKPSFEEARFNAQNVFNSLPDRKLVLKLIDQHKIEYNAELMNDPRSVSKYATEFYRAANLGIYGSDLTISSSFSQTQESMIFLKCVNILANSLGVSSAFDQKLFERIDLNENNKDSVLEIVTDAFRKVDEILKYNNRPATSAIILSGCWIEGLYVSCKMAEKVDREDIVKTILEQREALKNLIVMLEAVELEESGTFILSDLRGLYTTFDEVVALQQYDSKALDAITNKITNLRNKIISVPA
jgi:hypothetical protein